ncbi:MAG TPA: cytochrome c [Methylophaga sp.]|nr:cytochrome c [Methylophaga sp.]
MKYIAFTLLGLSAVFSTNAAFAAGDAAAGKAKAAICASCHGANGIAIMPAYPNLAGQNDAYIMSSLKAYRDKQRNGGMASIMQMQAANLSDADIENLAAYYSSLK